MRNARQPLAIAALASLLMTGCGPSGPSSRPSATPSPIPEICCGGQGSSPAQEAIPGIISATLGTVSQGPEITHTFLVTNKSTTESAIFEKPPQVNLPCCVSAELSEIEIEPGQSAELKVTYKTRIRPGPFDLFVRLFPKKGEVVEQYHLSGQVEKSFVVEPRNIDLSQEKTQEFVISGDKLNRDYKITEVKSNSPHLTVKKVHETDREFRYQVQWDGEPVTEEVPVVYIITDSKTFGWAPILIKGVNDSATSPPVKD